MRPLKLSVPMFQLTVIEMVLPAVNPVFSIMHVSCANGKLFNAGAPPEDVAHAMAFQLPPAARFQYLVTPAPNVMLLLFRQLPSRVPDQVPDAPAATMSRKSTSDKVAILATVKVR